MKYAGPVTVAIDMPDAPPGEGFRAAKALAQAEAGRGAGDAMLLSWKDNVTGASAPDVESCTCGMEGWELYAVSRGAELRVEVGGLYMFYFKRL